MDNSRMPVGNLGTPGIGARVSSPDTRHTSPRHANLYDVNGYAEYDPDRDGELLTGRQVRELLHIARSTLPLWRDRGDLVGYQMRNGHWRYPSRQPTLDEARRALQSGRAS